MTRHERSSSCICFQLDSRLPNFLAILAWPDTSPHSKVKSYIANKSILFDIKDLSPSGLLFIMATVELDPQFIKALRLLRSKSKDSGAQLRAMLDEAIRFKTIKRCIS